MRKSLISSKIQLKRAPLLIANVTGCSDDSVT